MEYRCVECGGRMTTLFVQYSPGNIRLMKCGNCKAVADEYIECEPIITLIDLILHKTKAYTHLLYNVIDPQTPSFQSLMWKSTFEFFCWMLESLPGKKQGRMGLVHELPFVTLEISKDADGYCLWKYHVSFNLCTRYEDSFQHIPQTAQGWECPVILIIDLFVSSSNTGTQSDNSVTYE